MDAPSHESEGSEAEGPALTFLRHYKMPKTRTRGKTLAQQLKQERAGNPRNPATSPPPQRAAPSQGRTPPRLPRSEEELLRAEVPFPELGGATLLRRAAPKVLSEEEQRAASPPKLRREQLAKATRTVVTKKKTQQKPAATQSSKRR